MVLGSVFTSVVGVLSPGGNKRKSSTPLPTTAEPRYLTDSLIRPLCRPTGRIFYPLFITSLSICALIGFLTQTTPAVNTTVPPPRYYHSFNSTPNAVDLLFERQSKTLPQASARYTLKTGRDPPNGFDKFFQYARNHHCLIDDYENIHRDFAPFYQLAEQDPLQFKRMLSKGMLLGYDFTTKLTTFKLTQSGSPRRLHKLYSPYSDDWTRILSMVSEAIPSMSVLFNYLDEPRVLFDARAPDAQARALDVQDDLPFNHKPPSTLSYFTSNDGNHGCIIPTTDTGFWEPVNNMSGFLTQATASGFTTDLYPILSQTKLMPCFADIVVPSIYYYQRSAWSQRFTKEDDIPWERKGSKLYWRGGTSGGQIIGNNTLYKQFPRFRFMDLAETRTDIMDAAFTILAKPNCKVINDCPASEIRARYRIKDSDEKADLHEVYNYKYLFDIDGNTFSGRYLGLLRTNSLVFKSTIFSEYFDGWLKPFEHYIPVRSDLSDLEDKVEWAILNDDEAQRIQRAGKEFATRVLTDEQSDCYFYLVLLEYLSACRKLHKSQSQSKTLGFQTKSMLALTSDGVKYVTKVVEKDGETSSGYITHESEEWDSAETIISAMYSAL